MRTIPLLLVGAGAVLLSACVTEGTPENGSGTAPAACEAAPAQSGIGQRYSEPLAQQLRAAANAREVRRLGPDTMTTMEFQADRLNVVVNARDIVTEVRCG